MNRRMRRKAYALLLVAAGSSSLGFGLGRLALGHTVPGAVFTAVGGALLISVLLVL